MTSAPATRLADTPADFANAAGAARNMSSHASISTASTVAASTSRLLERGEILRDHGHRLLVGAGRAELHDLGAGLDHGDVPGQRVVGVALVVGLLVVGVTERDPAALDEAPVRALAAVVRESVKEGSGVGVLPERLEADRVAAELLVAALHHAHVLHARRAVPRCLRHDALLIR